jgi:hypothetical protein
MQTRLNVHQVFSKFKSHIQEKKKFLIELFAGTGKYKITSLLAFNCNAAPGEA